MVTTPTFQAPVHSPWNSTLATLNTELRTCNPDLEQVRNGYRASTTVAAVQGPAHPAFAPRAIFSKMTYDTETKLPALAVAPATAAAAAAAAVTCH